MFQLLEQDKHELRLRLDAALMSSQQLEAEHRADLEDMQLRIDDVEARAAARQRADRQTIDELTHENERLSEQLLTVRTLRLIVAVCLSLLLLV